MAGTDDSGYCYKGGFADLIYRLPPMQQKPAGNLAHFVSFVVGEECFISLQICPMLLVLCLIQEYTEVKNKRGRLRSGIIHHMNDVKLT